MLKIDETKLDSRTYRKIFEFIKENGIEPLIVLINNISIIDSNSLIEDSIFLGKHRTLSLTKNNKELVEFLRTFDGNFLHIPITDQRFINFVLYTYDCIAFLDQFIENARLLEDLKICQIDFLNPRDFFEKQYTTQIWRNHKGIVTDSRKHYSDQDIIYSEVKDDPLFGDGSEEYVVKFKDHNNYPNWLIEVESHSNGFQFRYMDICDFVFNPIYLPTNNELNSFDEPKSLRLYKSKNR